MPSVVRTVKVPIRPLITPLAWPAKDPADVLDYTLDASAWLAESGHTLLDCDAYADPSLAATGKVLNGPGTTPTAVTLTIAGGTDGSVPVVPFLLRLDGGDQLAVAVRLPVQARIPTPVGLTSPAGTDAGTSSNALGTEAAARAAADAANAQALAAEVAAREAAGYLTANQLGVLLDAAISKALAGYVTVSTVNSAVQAAQEFVFTQSDPATLWTIVHNMGRRPAVTIVATSGDIVDGDVHYVDDNTVTAQFGAPFAGTAYLT